MRAEDLEERPPRIGVPGEPDRSQLLDRVGTVRVEEVPLERVGDIGDLAPPRVRLGDHLEALQQPGHSLLNLRRGGRVAEQQVGRVLRVQERQFLVVLHRGLGAFREEVAERRRRGVVERAPVLAEQIREHDVDELRADRRCSLGNDLRCLPLRLAIDRAVCCLRRVREHDTGGGTSTSRSACANCPANRTLRRGPPGHPHG